MHGVSPVKILILKKKMSSRVLKKLHGGPDLEIIEKDANNLGGGYDDDDDIQSDIENDSNNSTAKKKQFNINRYDLLNEQSLSESEVKEDDNETEHASTATPHPCEQTKKKKKKRKKKSGKQSSTTYKRSSEDNADIDEITRTVREVDKLFGERNRHTTVSGLTTNITIGCSSNPVINALLAVQHKNLNPANEMKRMFGSKVVQAEQNKRRNTRGPRTLKSTWLVSAKENWPPVTKTGIFMSIEQNNGDSQQTQSTTNDANTAGSITGIGSSGNSKGMIWFRFEHNGTYRALQQQFLTAVESMDSDNIVQIIKQQPYHIDSLIQLSEICKISEDYALASELIEHAILALESSFHSMFNLTAGNCRLDYRRQENRCLFIVLFKHAQYLEGRACAKTALEVAKLLLSFDPINDPLALLLILDYYALRSRQYEWLIQLYGEWESTNNLSQLPNMAYSYALALFYVHKNDDLSDADRAMQYAVLMFPGVIRSLLTELSIQPDGRVDTHNYFGVSTLKSQPSSLQQLVSLYVCRAKNLWRDEDILPWLERNVNIVLDRVDGKDDIVQEYKLKRDQRYKTPPREILRHIVLSDFKEKVPLAPFINKDTEPILMYDPLPPLNSINVYNRPNMTPATRIPSNASPFSMFFQSLSPNFNMQSATDSGGAAAAPTGLNNYLRNRQDGQQNNQPQHPDMMSGDSAAVAAAGNSISGGTAAFVESLNVIMDAMRDFLSNIRVPERPNDADVDENESTEDDTNDYLT